MGHLNGLLNQSILRFLSIRPDFSEYLSMESSEKHEWKFVKFEDIQVSIKERPGNRFGNSINLLLTLSISKFLTLEILFQDEFKAGKFYLNIETI